MKICNSCQDFETCIHIEKFEIWVPLSHDDLDRIQMLDARSSGMSGLIYSSKEKCKTQWPAFNACKFISNSKDGSILYYHMNDATSSKSKFFAYFKGIY